MIGGRVHVHANGTRLWFDVDGAALAPDGDRMRRRPTVVLVHGGPGSYDHSYFKPHFGRLAEHAQVIYLDLRGHGRSDWDAADEWTFEACADDIRTFCDVLGIERPVVLGHSMGGPIVLLYGARHSGHAAGLGVLSGFARFDVARLVEGFRGVAGDEVAALAERAYSGSEIADDDWPPVFAAFGPAVPDEDALERRTQNLELNAPGMDLTRGLDIVDLLGAIDVPTLVLVGELDPVTPVDASEEIVRAMRPGVARLEVLPRAGHFPWLDVPDRFFSTLAGFARSVSLG